MHKHFGVWVMQDLYEPPDNLGGGGAGGGNGQPGQGGTGQGDGTGTGGGGGTAVRVTGDDFEFIPPGSDKPVKYGDFIRGYVPRTEHETKLSAYGTAADMLKRAEEIDKARRTGQPANQTAQQKVDAFAKLRGQPVLDGDTMAGFLEEFANGNMKPIVDVINNMGKLLQRYEQRFGELDKRVGNHDSQRTTQAIDGMFDGAFKTLGIDRTNTPMVDLAEFFYNGHSGWDPADPKPFADRFGSWFKDLRKAMRALDAADADKAKGARKTFIPTRGGNANPGGKPARLTPREIARQAFGSVNGSRT